jgi:hypothetical protein
VNNCRGCVADVRGVAAGCVSGRKATVELLLLPVLPVRKAFMVFSREVFAPSLQIDYCSMGAKSFLGPCFSGEEN